ncbi:MAG: rRNA pseudouridine synthase [Solirubrobacterales bacterium]|nr:rRNA pseudouridine synthase [Solirubrobacterales bacterium]
MRLARYLAHGGVASRRAAEVLIRDGRVSVGGEVVTDPARDVDGSSGVEVDGSPVEAEPREVWALNKPLDVVSTASEPGSRRAVVELVSSERRLYPVGRLDADSTGLILLTNDGDLANRLTHPRYGVRKTYRVELATNIGDRAVERLRSGVELEDGPTAPAQVMRRTGKVLDLTIREGRKRQVRRMAEAIGNEVASLERIRIGSLELGDLPAGEARLLGEAEVAALWEDSRPS